MTTHRQMKQWIEAATRELKGRPLESLNRETPEGICVKPIYTHRVGRTHGNRDRWTNRQPVQS
ncbi:MAG: hypothetical protein R6W75_11325, partial [Smithellaceae bacterium]